MIEYLKYLKCRCCGSEFDRNEVKGNGYRCPVCGQEELRTVVDHSMVHIKGCVINIGDKIDGHTVTAIFRDPFNGGMVIQTDEMIHHTPDGDFGADWFENVSYHIT